MKLKVYLIIGLAVAIAIIIGLIYKMQNIEEKNNTLVANQETLLTDVQQYKLMDSLNVIRIGELNLTLDEYKKFRAEDQKIIDELKADKITLIEKISTETRIEKETVPLVDTVFVSIVDTVVRYEKLKAFNYNSKWNDVTGVITQDSVILDIVNREELIITESLQKKKFWFIKLPPSIFGYKSRTIDIVSKNPKTQIKSAEVIKIE